MIKTLLFAVGGGALPPLVWLWFWLKEDRARPEPKKLILKAFVVGGIAVVFALFLEVLTARWLQSSPIQLTTVLSLPPAIFDAYNVQLLFTWALIEEVLKFFLIYLAVLRDKNFDEPIDAMIYMITGAIGFAILENILFLLSTLSSDASATFLITGNLRFLGANILHIVSSSIVGGAIALSFCKSRAKKTTAVFLGLVAATLLHTLFNFFIIWNGGREISKVLLVLWVAAISVILFFERVKQIVCGVDFKSKLKLNG